MCVDGELAGRGLDRDVGPAGFVAGNNPHVAGAINSHNSHQAYNHQSADQKSEKHTTAAGFGNSHGNLLQGITCQPKPWFAEIRPIMVACSLVVDKITVLVLADPAIPPLRKLDAVGPGVEFRIGKTADSLGDAVADARVLFNCNGAKPEVRQILERAPRLEWIHAMYAGLDRTLFPELVASPIPLTNGSGVFSQSLGEFVMLGVLYFAKEVDRMMKAKAEHRWDVYDKVEIRKQTMGIVAHGDIGQAVAWRAKKALGMRVLAQRRNPAARAGDEHVDPTYMEPQASTRCYPNATMSP